MGWKIKIGRIGLEEPLLRTVSKIALMEGKQKWKDQRNRHALGGFRPGFANQTKSS